MNTKRAPEFAEVPADKQHDLHILASHPPGNENHAATKVHLIRIHNTPLSEDDGSTLVYLSPQGTYHEVLGVIDHNYPDKRGWKDVYAVQSNVHGRLRQLFLSAEAVITETVWPPAPNDLVHPKNDD